MTIDDTSDLNLPVAVVLISSDDDKLHELRAFSKDSATTNKGFDGSDAIGLLVPLIPPAIAAIVSVYNAHIKARKHISVVVDGIEIRGVSEKKLAKIVEAAAKHREEIK